MKTIIHIVIKEFLQFKRDPKMFAIVLVAPIFQMVLLGFAATIDVEAVHMIIFDQDKSSVSRELVQRFESVDIFKIDGTVESYPELEEKIQSGTILFALVIPDDCEKKIQRRETAPLQALFNGSDGNTASIALGYISTIVTSFSKWIITDVHGITENRQSPFGTITTEARVWYNPNQDSQHFMVPAIVGLLLSIITLLLTSLAIVKEKEIGTIEQLIVTPIRPYQLMIGKLIPFVILGFMSIVVVIVAMKIIFAIPIRGSIPLLFSAAFLYVLSTLGLGMFISTISKTQQQAMMIAVFAVMMPMVFFSGFSFPIENMPVFIQYISYAIPLRYFITIIRGIVLKGNGIVELWFDFSMLLAIGVIILTLSSMRFRKRIE